MRLQAIYQFLDTVEVQIIITVLGVMCRKCRNFKSCFCKIHFFSLIYTRVINYRYSRALDSTYGLISDNTSDTFDYQGDKAVEKKSTETSKQ